MEAMQEDARTEAMEANGPPTRHPLTLHRRALAIHGRCPFCAEHVGAFLVLRGKACPHCGSELRQSRLCSPDELISYLREQWGRWRWIAFPLIAVATAIAGFIPLLGGVVRLVGMVVIHIVFVRRPLFWLSMWRRLASRATLRLYLVTLALLGLIVDALVAPLAGVNALISSLTSILIAVAYAEGSLAFICTRMKQEAKGERLAWWEWAVPGALFLALLGITAGLVATLTAMVRLITLLPEFVTGLTRWLSP